LGTFVSTAFRAYFKDAKREKLKIYRVSGCLASPDAGPLFISTQRPQRKGRDFLAEKFLEIDACSQTAIGASSAPHFGPISRTQREKKLKLFRTVFCPASSE
jgi:hypothetical protein